MPTPLRLHIHPNPVRIQAQLDEAGDLTLQCCGVLLSDGALEIHSPNPTQQTVTLEVHDFQDASGRQWTVAVQDPNSEWARSNGCCSQAWSETDGEVRIDVTATHNGESKTTPAFIKVPPEGDRPW